MSKNNKITRAHFRQKYSTNIRLFRNSSALDWNSLVKCSVYDTYKYVCRVVKIVDPSLANLCLFNFYCESWVVFSFGKGRPQASQKCVDIIYRIFDFKSRSSE